MFWLFACHPPEPPPPVATPVLLDDVQLLRRLSLDLRGTMPTLSEVSRLEADPNELDALRDEYAVYVVGDSRINIAGLSGGRHEPFAAAVAKVIGLSS